jgi:hypothetical protein
MDDLKLNEEDETKHNILLAKRNDKSRRFCFVNRNAIIKEIYWTDYAKVNDEITDFESSPEEIVHFSRKTSFVPYKKQYNDALRRNGANIHVKQEAIDDIQSESSISSENKNSHPKRPRFQPIYSDEEDQTKQTSPTKKKAIKREGKTKKITKSHLTQRQLARRRILNPTTLKGKIDAQLRQK